MDSLIAPVDYLLVLFFFFRGVSQFLAEKISTKYKKYMTIMTNLKNVLNYKCRLLGNGPFAGPGHVTYPPLNLRPGPL